MDAALIFGVPIGLFAAAFITKRRLGLLVLGLCAGAVLSPLWAGSVASVVLADIDTDLPVEQLVGAMLIFLPVVPVLVKGPKVKGLVPRLVASGGFVVMALCLVLQVLDPVIVTKGFVHTMYEFIRNNQPLIVSGGIFLAMMDVMSIKGAPAHHKESGRH